MEWNYLLNSNRVRPTAGGDSRLEFERDYDRSVFSTPVKRLQDKAQVFPLEPHDAIRTRLTHSLEVSTVARGLAIFVCKHLLEKRKIEPSQQRQIEAIAATCGLIHDLGNPPFGHAGEYAIQEWFKKFGNSELDELLKHDNSLIRAQMVQDFLKFEGNAQTLRLVARLQVLSDMNGLNLTFGTLSAAMKYTASSVEANPQHTEHSKKKPGFFTSEEELVKRVHEETRTAGKRNPITFLVEAADDIVYSVADVEDGIKKSVVRWDDVTQQLKIKASEDFDEVLKRMSRILATPVEEFGKFDDDILGSAFRTAAIGVLVEDASYVFTKNYPAIMEGSYLGELVLDGERTALAAALKNNIGPNLIYRTPSNLKLELMGRKIIHDLMDLFWEGAKSLPLDGKIKTKNFVGKIQALFSKNYLTVFQFSVQNGLLPAAYSRLQLVTDYVCGMTDSFAKRLHSELTNG